MRLAIINDTHAGGRGDSLIFNEFFFQFWENTFFPYIEDPQNHINRIVHLGDFVDRRKYINYVILNQWRHRFFDRLASGRTFHGGPMGIDILVGNHDTPFRNTNHPNAIQELFGSWDNVLVIEEPKIRTYGNLPVLLLPWINDQNRQDSMDLISNASVSHVFGHLEISGFEMDRGNVCHEGLDRTVFNRFENVYSGHFHHRSTDGTIFYLGAQYEITWADYNDQKGFHVFDTDTKQLEFIPNPNRMFYKHEYNDGGQINPTEVTGKHVKIVVKNRKDANAFDKYVDDIHKLGPADLQIVEAGFSTIDGQTQEITVDETEDLLTSLNKYVETREIDQSQGVKDTLRDIHLEALQMEAR